MKVFDFVLGDASQHLKGSMTLPIVEMRQGKHETASHDVESDDVTWPIRIYVRASIEHISGNFVRVHDDYWLTGCVEVDEVTWSNPVLFKMSRERTEKGNLPYSFCHSANLSHCPDLSSRRFPMIG